MERKSPLVDVTNVSFDSAQYDSTALTESLRSILEDLERQAKAISGWSSFLDEEDSDD